MEAVHVVNMADLDADGRVDGDDVGTLPGARGSGDCDSNLDGVGIVNGSDLGTLYGNWSGGNPASIGTVCDEECGAQFGEAREELMGSEDSDDPEAAEERLAERLGRIGFESVDAVAA